MTKVAVWARFSHLSQGGDWQVLIDCSRSIRRKWTRMRGRLKSAKVKVKTTIQMIRVRFW